MLRVQASRKIKKCLNQREGTLTVHEFALIFVNITFRIHWKITVERQKQMTI